MTAKKRYLVTGRQGQVVQSLLERCRQSDDIELFAVGRPDIDLTEPETLEAIIDHLNPDLVVSAAAYTAVDQAETDEQQAWAVNASGPGELARIVSQRNIPLVHLSTDYVFDGSSTRAYVETDPVSPLGVYGRTKLEGERRIQAAADNVAILRTAWVFSPFGKNFVKTMLRVAETRESLNVVDDQIGNPTSALDIADGILAVAANLFASQDVALRGVFHMTGSGEASWADFAKYIFSISSAEGGPHADISPIPTSAYPTPARRPANSRLDCSKLSTIHGVRLADWKLTTQEIVKRLVQAKACL
ncbi:dTDP-4-dehydrorhamnose reductase [Rhizobium sp.]|jgi:dTDP-4-dehydrorhamnose reductase|uniref:dTDP-4-dehydrorhamnose reductase n=1 Tax=Rhizobium sp. TaxID=391 RepID=UPI000E9EDCD9|nr:dTDP-4-dehydrorhamnose reductase [Rhizobium sp.]